MKPLFNLRTQPIEAVVLRVTMWLLAFFSLVAIAATLTLHPPTSAAAAASHIGIPVAISIACGAAMLLARIGRPRIGACVVLAVTYLAVVQYLIVSGLGLRSHATGLFALLIIAVALLIGYRASLWAAAVAIVTVIGLYALESSGWSIDQEAVQALRSDNILVVYCILFGGTATMLYLFSKALHDSLRATSDQEQRFRQLIDQAPYGYVMHRDGHVLMVNRVAAAATGLDTPEHAIGRSIFELLPAEQRQFAGARVAAADVAAPGSDTPAEYRLTDQRGRERRIEALTMRLMLSDGPTLLTVLRDVTRERETSAALQIAKQEAESASAAKSQFLANMSHEIRTPLNGVLGMADLLQGTALGAEQRRYCNAIRASGRALHDLLGDILDLAKIEAGKIELEQEDFEPSRLIDELVTAYRELSTARGNNFRTTIQLPAGLRLTGDSLRLRQVLTNLLGNAIKFTENGWIELGVQAQPPRASDHRRWVCFTVRDSGIGMSSETVRKLFQPFCQADSSTTRQYGGTGLGLTIVKHLVDLMGGSIDVDSNPGSGSEFRVELPFAPAHAALAAPAVETPTTAETAGVSLTVLLVEDNDINQDVACTMLGKAGHRVEVAGDGAQALYKFVHGKFDLILMDCQMPVMDGFEAARGIRAREAKTGTNRTRIVALTANAMAGDRERCLAAGMDDVLSKPFDAMSLLAAVARTSTCASPEARRDEKPVSFDPVVFEELVKLDRDTPGLLAKFTGRFIDGTPALIDCVAGITRETSVAAERAAHSLRSTSAYFGAMALAGLAAEAEAAAKAGRIDEARILGAAMRVEFDRAIDRMPQQGANMCTMG